MKEFWNKRYAAAEYAYGEAPNKFFKNWVEKMAPGTILFPAEGEGRNAVYAARLGWEVYAYDYSEEGQKKALVLAQKNDVSIHYDVISGLDYSNAHSFDAIVLIYAHFPPDMRSLIHQKLVGLLNPGGTLILEGYNKQQLKNETGGPKDESFLFEEGMLRQDFEGLQILSVENATLHMEEGLFHNGTSDIIRLVARK
jgi:SAM-dependent methyltransferase